MYDVDMILRLWATITHAPKRTQISKEVYVTLLRCASEMVMHGMVPAEPRRTDVRAL